MKIKLLTISIFLLLQTFVWAQETAPSDTSASKKDTIPLSDKLLKGVDKLQMGATEVKKYVDRAYAVHKQVVDNNSFQSLLNGKDVKLPIGVKRTIGNMDYIITLDSIIITPTHAYAVMYMVMENPNNGERLYFLGKDIRFSKNGGFTGDGVLQLMETYNVDVGPQTNIKFLADSTHNTFVQFDCNGFKKLYVDGRVDFSRQMLVPDDGNGAPLSEGQVSADFSVEVTDWSDWIVELKDIADFQVKGVNGVTFSVENMIFDFSDLRNPESVTFPEGYTSTTIGVGMDDLWRGFYMQRLQVKLPQEFKKRTNQDRVTLSLEHAIIDEMGFSGAVIAENLIALQEGDMDGWAYSLDYLDLSFQKNSLTSASFEGAVLVPITKEEQSFSYTAIFDPDSVYAFVVTNNDELQFPLWGGNEVVLSPNSSVEVVVQEHRFKPKAILSGKMNLSASINGNEGENNMSDRTNNMRMAQISFQELTLQTERPYLGFGSNGGVSFGASGSSHKMGKFPVQLTRFEIVSEGDDIGFGIGVSVNLVAPNESGFGVEGDATLFGTLSERNGIPSWRYKKLRLNSLGIDINNGGFSLEGRVEFFRSDPLYGSGFRGDLLAEFSPGILVGATALFGNTSSIENGVETNWRYWYADALAKFPSPMPIFTGIGINGFGGGAYYRMKMAPRGYKAVSNLGKSRSGIVYLPNRNTGLGVKAAMYLVGMPNAQTFNGEINLDLLFSSSGGLSQVGFYGFASFLTPSTPGDVEGRVSKNANKVAEKVFANEKIIPSSRASTSETKQKTASLNGNGKFGVCWRALLDIENNSFHANLEVLVNIPNVLQGVGDNGAAGEFVMHFEPGYWYVHAGTPRNPIKVDFVGLVQTGAYFMTGNYILPFEPMPKEVEAASLLQVDQVSEGTLSSGFGVAFGARMDMTTGDRRFAIFYYKLSAGLGFDISLFKSDEPLYCEERPNSPIGINNWYARGQAYAYFHGEIGLKARVFRKTRTFKIAELAASMAIAGKGPNPTHFQGAVSVRYSFLGGLVRGRGNLKVSLGRHCTVVGGSALDGIRVISDVTPGYTRNNSVFTYPQALFNMGLNEIIEVIDYDDNGKRRLFKASLVSFKVWYGNNRQIGGHVEFNDMQDLASFIPDEILPSNTKIEMEVVVDFKEYVNGVWVSLEGELEKREAWFYTGEEPNFIPLTNVKHAFPMTGMRNVYKMNRRELNGRTIGDITLVSRQTKAFELPEGYHFEMRLYNNDGKEVYTTRRVRIKRGRFVFFPFPTDDLDLASKYKLEIVKAPDDPDVEAKVYREESKGKSEGEVEVGEASETYTEIRDNTGKGQVVVNYPIYTIYSTEFVTSEYSSFNEKMELLKARDSYFKSGLSIYKNFSNSVSERFSGIEKMGRHNSGTIFFKPLIRSEINGNYSYLQKVEREIYDAHSSMLNWRGTTKPSLNPIDAVFLYSKESSSNSTSTVNLYKHLGNKDLLINNSNMIQLAYPRYVYEDYKNIRKQLQQIFYARYSNIVHSRAYKEVLDNPDAAGSINSFLLYEFKPMFQGSYTVNINYYLPGENEPNATTSVNFINKYEAEFKGYIGNGIYDDIKKTEEQHRRLLSQIHVVKWRSTISSTAEFRHIHGHNSRQRYEKEKAVSAINKLSEKLKVNSLFNRIFGR